MGGVAMLMLKRAARRQRRFPSSSNDWAMSAATPPSAMSHPLFHALPQVSAAVPSQLASLG